MKSKRKVTYFPERILLQIKTAFVLDIYFS